MARLVCGLLAEREGVRTRSACRSVALLFDPMHALQRLQSFIKGVGPLFWVQGTSTGKGAIGLGKERMGMRRGKSIWPVVVLLLGCLELEAVAQQSTGTVHAAGGLVRITGRQAFRLDLSVSSESVPKSSQALLVYAEPSHSLLLAHVDASIGDTAAYQGALALTRGSAQEVRHSLVLPYEPFTDKRIVVVLKDGTGRESVVADATLNLRSFDFSTSFEVDPIAGTIYHHCCRGSRCDQICVDCDTPEFTCDLVECDIQCGHGGSDWPPKV